MSFHLHRPSEYSPDDSSFQRPETKTGLCHPFDGSTLPDMCLGYPQYPDSPPPVRGWATPATTPEQGCLFRSEVLDECGQSRFWGRAMEYYLLDDVSHSPPYRCLMASCMQRDFKDVRSMLRHLKACKLFPQGRFWCPTCNCEDSFKVVSKKKCSWDRVNFARKLFERSRKALQSISGHGSKVLCAKCLCPLREADLPILTPPPRFSELQLHQAEQAEQAEFRWELPGPAPPELGENQQSNYAELAELPQRTSCVGLPIPDFLSHQASPSQESSASSGLPGYSSNVSPTSATLANDSPILGGLYAPENIAIAATPLPPSRHTSRRANTPSLSVDTRHSVADMSVPQWGFNMFLDEDQILPPTSGIDSLGVVDITPVLIAPEPSEIFTPDSPYAIRAESLLPHNNMHLHPSPSGSAPSFSSYELAPSSASSGGELQCSYNGCEFKPTGKTESALAYMRKHVKTHKNESIQCPHCTTRIKRQDNLTSHIRKKHAAVHETAAKRRRDSEDSAGSSGPMHKEFRT